MDRNTFAGLTGTIAVALGTLAGHYVWDLYKGKKYACELPSDVIKAMNSEYGIPIEVCLDIYVFFAKFAFRI